MTGLLISLGSAAVAFLAGAATAYWMQERSRPVPLDPPEELLEAVVETPVLETPQAAPEPPERSNHLVSLLAGGLRDVLRAVRRSNAPGEITAQVERLHWQARMLVAAPRPMKAAPTSPITLLQQAAEDVEALRLGKVNASWSVRSRQPVHVDPERARGAFRELLIAAVDAVGEGGRLAVRVRQGERQGYPVCVELEIGRRGVELESLAFLVARRVLEGQGALVELDGTVTRIELRTLGPEPPELPE